MIIGIDLGGMSAKAALLNGERLEGKSRVVTSAENTAEETAIALAHLAMETAEKAGKRMENVQAIGIGAPGVVDSAHGNIVQWSNFHWKDVPLGALVEKYTGKKTFILNDANAAALGEAKYGAAKQFSDSVLVTLGTAYRANGEPEKGVPIAKELAKRDGLSNEEMLKVSSLLCELGLHSDVFEYARRMEKQFAYDGNVLFMEGIAAINCGMEEEAKEVFDRLLTLYPDAAVVEYYLKAAEEGSISSASYLYRVPPEERQLREEKLEELTELTVSDLRNRYSAEMDEIEELFDWCFDEMDGQDLRLQAIAVTLALNADAREYLEDLLLDYQVNDVIKTEVVRNLCIRNKECSLRIVVHNTYQIVTLPTLHIGRKAHKKFMEGYALCMSHFGLRAEGLTELIPPIAGVLYGSLAEKNLLDEVDSAETVAASICSLCGLHEENDALRMLCLIVGANYDKVFRFLEVYRGSEK